MKALVYHVDTDPLIAIWVVLLFAVSAVPFQAVQEGSTMVRRNPRVIHDASLLELAPGSMGVRSCLAQEGWQSGDSHVPYSEKR